MVTLKDIREGSVVVLRPSFGIDPPIQITVEQVEPNIKHGEDGILYKDRWAYLYQVERVVVY